MTDLLQKTIEDMVPKLLDDIVRKHRDECKILMSTINDFASLAPMVSSMSEQKQVRATIDEYRIICLLAQNHKLLFLTGIRRADCVPYMTSDVVSVDFANNFVLTKNSLYEIGSKGEGEPDFHILLHICAVLHKWGVGNYYGIPHIFY